MNAPAGFNFVAFYVMAIPAIAFPFPPIVDHMVPNSLIRLCSGYFF